MEHIRSITQRKGEENSTEKILGADCLKYRDTAIVLGTVDETSDIDNNNVFIGYNNHIIGESNVVNGEYVSINGISSHAEGLSTTVENDGGHAEGKSTLVKGKYAHAEGIFSNKDVFIPDKTIIAFASNLINNWCYVKEELDTKIKYYVYSTITSKYYPITLGDKEKHDKKDGYLSIIDLDNTVMSNVLEKANQDTGLSLYRKAFEQKGAEGEGSHSEGISTYALGRGAHSEGRVTQALGDYSHAEGYLTKANHIGSHASGIGTETGADYQTVIGKYNAIVSDSLFVIGNGDITKRSNALEVKKDGTVNFPKGITVNSGDPFKSTLESLYPVGSVYMSFNDTLPQKLVDLGQWRKVENDYVLRTGSNIKSTPQYGIGVNEILLTIDNLPSHSHQASGDVMSSPREWMKVKKHNMGTGLAGKGLLPIVGPKVRVIVEPTGGNQAFSVRPPSLAVNIWYRIK